MGQSAINPSRAGPAARVVGISMKGCDRLGSRAWRELDRTLADRRISVKGLAAAGPGAVLAAVLAHGLTIGGSQGGRAALAIFRTRLASAARKPPKRYSPTPTPLAAAAVSAFDFLDPSTSPYGVRRPEEHPMKSILEDMIDFAGLRDAGSVQLHVSASEVRTGRDRIFTGADIDLPAILASASIPLFHPAVEIGGEHYWQSGDAAWPELDAVLRQACGGDVIEPGLPRRRPGERRRQGPAASEV